MQQFSSDKVLDSAKSKKNIHLTYDKWETYDYPLLIMRSLILQKEQIFSYLVFSRLQCVL
jgi:hypothetical protein